MATFENIFPKIHNYTDQYFEVEMSHFRKLLMTQWENPADPTITGEFNVNISCLDMFNKKYPEETLTTLMLQAVSKTLTLRDSFRNFLIHKKLHQSKEAYVSIVVKLPGCGDHIGAIIFENCHTMSVPVLAARIRAGLQLMVFCYKKREELERKHPHLKKELDRAFYDFTYTTYPFPILGNPVVEVTNVGFCGWTQGKAPIRNNEKMKLTMFQPDRKLVWNRVTKTFEEQDILPVSITADHRIFDANTPVPKLVNQTFQEMYERMTQCQEKPQMTNILQYEEIMRTIEEFIHENVELAYKALAFLQTMWIDYFSVSELFNNEEFLKQQSSTKIINEAFSLYKPKRDQTPVNS